MSLESALYNIAASNGAVAALVSTRIYRTALPPGAVMPALVYRRVSNDPFQSHKAQEIKLERTRFTWDCWASDTGTAESLANAVKLLFNGYRGTVDGRKIGGTKVVFEGDLPDPDTNLSLRVVDVLIFDEGDDS